MNWRLIWYRATHHCISRDNWIVVIGPDIHETDYGITYNRDILPPNSFSGDYKRWRVQWRINIRWPVSIRRRVARS